MSGGRFNGYGQQWWDNGIRTLRPQLATFNVTNGYITRLKVIKPVAWGWNIPGKNILIENHYVDAKPNNGTRDSTISFPFNTDGFNLSGQNITLDGYWGENGDDCVSVVNGARNIVAKVGLIHDEGQQEINSWRIEWLLWILLSWTFNRVSWQGRRRANRCKRTL